jgi:hypothetical protein
MTHLSFDILDKVVSIDRFATVLVDKGLAGQNIEGGGIEITKEFVLITNKEKGGGITFPVGLRIRM